MLNEVYTSGTSLVKTEKLKEESFLKDIYLSSNIEVAEVFSIASDELRFIYLSINYGKDFEIDSNHRNMNRLFVSELRNLFKTIEL